MRRMNCHGILPTNASTCAFSSVPFGSTCRFNACVRRDPHRWPLRSFQPADPTSRVLGGKIVRDGLRFSHDQFSKVQASRPRQQPPLADENRSAYSAIVLRSLHAAYLEIPSRERYKGWIYPFYDVRKLPCSQTNLFARTVLR